MTWEENAAELFEIIGATPPRIHPRPLREQFD